VYIALFIVLCSW